MNNLPFQHVLPYPQPLLREMVLKKSVHKAAHQWTWDEQPTQGQLIILLARLQWLCGLARWAGPIGNPHL